VQEIAAALFAMSAVAYVWFGASFALVAGALVPGHGFVAFLLLVVWIPMVAILVYRGQPVTPEQP
jgi:hypothetical protein